MLKFEATYTGKPENGLIPGSPYVIKIEDPKVKKITKDSPNEDFANAILDGVALRFPLWAHAVVDESKPTWGSNYYQNVKAFNDHWAHLVMLDKFVEPLKK